MPTFVNHRNSKTLSISLYFAWLSILGKHVFVYFSTVNPYVTQHRIVHSTSLTSFVHVGCISNSVCSPTGRVMDRELWTHLGDSVAFHLQTWSPEYWAENVGINSSNPQSGIILHKRIHSYGQYNFNRRYCLDMRRNVDLLCASFCSPWRVRIWRTHKQRGFFRVIWS